MLADVNIDAIMFPLFLGQQAGLKQSWEQVGKPSGRSNKKQNSVQDKTPLCISYMCMYICMGMLCYHTIFCFLLLISVQPLEKICRHRLPTSIGNTSHESPTRKKTLLHIAVFEYLQHCRLIGHLEVFRQTNFS